MRVMMPGQADAVEFRLIDGIWMGESGATVEIGAIMAAPDSAPAGSSALRVRPPRFSAAASALQH